MGLREWLIVGGVVLVGLILFDGWRRISARHNKIRMDIDPSAQGADTEGMSHNPELPNGGARMKASQQDPVSSSLAGIANDPLLEDDPLVEQAIAVLQADLDKETELLSGMRAEREINSVFEVVMDDGDFVSKPRVAQTQVKAQESEKSKAESVAARKGISETESVELSETITEPVSVSSVESETQIRNESTSLAAEEQPGIESEEVADVAEEDKYLEPEPSSSPTEADIELALESLESGELSVDELSPESAKSLETNKKPSAPSIQEKMPPNNNTQDSQGALGEVDDLFALSDLDFDRPIHELMDANAEAEKPEVSQGKPKRTNKPKKQSIEKTGSLFDELLDQVDETEPLDDIESLVAESTSLDIDEPIAETAGLKAPKTGRQHRELDFTDSELALVILVVAKKGQRLPGSSLRSIVEACGMEFGQMSLFHRYEDESERSPIQFSMSDAIQPGSFNIDSLDEYETPAVSFFMSLAEPRDLLYAFDCMLATAETLAKHLDAQLLDGEHSTLRAQTKEHYRERIQNYKLKHRAQNRRVR